MVKKCLSGKRNEIICNSPQWRRHGCFVVVQSENTRLAPGDTFECQLFIAHEPAYLNNWRHADNPPAVYVIGKKDGIIIENHFL